MTHLIIIRGLPGSGKSTLARLLVVSNGGGVHFEADMYFINKYGEYKFDSSKLNEAHEWCYEQVVSALGEPLVVVSNTFSQIWEMKRYLKLSRKTTVLTCEGNYGSIHKVPPEIIERMKARWEMYHG